MVRYGIARSRFHAFDIVIERGLAEVVKEVEFWDSIHRKVEELEKQELKLKHSRLNR